jgi:hypothetical protein
MENIEINLPPHNKEEYKKMLEINKINLEKLFKNNELLLLGQETFGNEIEFSKWLITYNQGFNARPIEQPEQEINNMLIRIQY